MTCAVCRGEGQVHGQLQDNIIHPEEERDRRYYHSTAEGTSQEDRQGKTEVYGYGKVLCFFVSSTPEGKRGEETGNQLNGLVGHQNDTGFYHETMGT